MRGFEASTRRIGAPRARAQASQSPGGASPNESRRAHRRLRAAVRVRPASRRLAFRCSLTTPSMVTAIVRPSTPSWRSSLRPVALLVQRRVEGPAPGVEAPFGDRAGTPAVVAARRVLGAQGQRPEAGEPAGDAFQRQPHAIAMSDLERAPAQPEPGQGRRHRRLRGRSRGAGPRRLVHGRRWPARRGRPGSFAGRGGAGRGGAGRGGAGRGRAGRGRAGFGYELGDLVGGHGRSGRDEQPAPGGARGGEVVDHGARQRLGDRRGAGRRIEPV